MVQCNTPKLSVVMNNVVNSTVRNRRKAIGTRRIFKTISQFILLIHHCNQALAKILFIVSTSLLFNLKLLVNTVGSGVIMKSLIKAGLLGTALTAVIGLTACQSSTAPQDKPHHPMMHKDGDRGHHMKRHHRNMTPEQRAEWDKRRAERQMHYQQLQQACAGKPAGQTVQLKMADKTIEGTCEMRFKPKRTATVAPQPSTAQPLTPQPAAKPVA